MIASLVATTLHHALLDKPCTDSRPCTDKPTAGSVGGATRPPVGGGSIAKDLGQLTTDTLTLLGLGGGSAASGGRAAQAYANSGGLAQ